MTEKLQPLLEAILFSANEPVSINELADNLNYSKGEIEEQLKKLDDHYCQEKHGLKLKNFQKGFLLCTSPELSEKVEKVLTSQQKVKLSEAAMETLAIIAYFQPITRNEIEEIRGVRVDTTLRTLQKYELIKEKGRRDQPGRPIIYGTTEDFLYFFGISDLSQLPKREKVLNKFSTCQEETSKEYNQEEN